MDGSKLYHRRCIREKQRTLSLKTDKHRTTPSAVHQQQQSVIDVPDRAPPARHVTNITHKSPEVAVQPKSSPPTRVAPASRAKHQEK